MNTPDHDVCVCERVCSGCEFFKDYKDRDYTAEGLVFNWNQVDPHLDRPRQHLRVRFFSPVSSCRIMSTPL